MQQKLARRQVNHERATKQLVLYLQQPSVKRTWLPAVRPKRMAAEQEPGLDVDGPQ